MRVLSFPPPSSTPARHPPLSIRDQLIFAAAIVFGLLGAGIGLAQPKAVTYRYDQVAQARARPVASAAEQECFTQAASGTPTHAFNTDVASGSRDANFIQNVRIVNRHATNMLCVRAFDFAVSCAATCAASGLTCNATAATDGDPSPPGIPYVLPLEGDVCMCVAASAASTTTTACRVSREMQ